MIAEALQAWVIHKYWSGDTSARVVFFTRERGLVNGLFKGGRTPKKQALLQAFTPLWLTLTQRGEACFVQHLETLGPPLQLMGPSLFASLYVNELIFHTMKPLDAHPGLHKAYETTLEILQTVSDRHALEAILRRFEWILLRSCGYHMSLTQEAYTAVPILDNQYYRMIPGEGFVTAEEGILGAHILALEAGKLNDIDVLKSVKRILRSAIDHALDGKIIKTRLLYQSNPR
jgi:DNA repair protein RecO (recombination protein O)